MSIQDPPRQKSEKMAENQNPQSATYFPLRWESTGDKWWYASPIDFAAANNHYDLVRELIRLDANHLISLTSLRRLRRLESVWEDDGAAAKSRSAVARRLLHESEISISAGYGAWLLYTAASAGDLEFLKELLAGDPLLVFGEGEYGMTDMLYAAARSGSAEAFWTLYDFAAKPRFEVPVGFKSEVINRAIHAAARGGNSAVVAELLAGAGDAVSGYRDACGSTVLHSAACRGQVQVVKYLITAYDEIVSATDNEGNTALHIAAYKGQLSALEVLLTASPSSITATNESGNTLLHMAISGSLIPSFQRLETHINLMRQLITARDKFSLEDIINSKNNQGRTALHIAIIGNVNSNLVELLMTARYIDVNVRDDHGLTALDYLRNQPRSLSSEMLIRQLISAGGMSDCRDHSARKVFASHLRSQGGVCSSPGTSFRDLDCEIFKCSGMEARQRGVTVSESGSNQGLTMMMMMRLKSILKWPKMNKKRIDKEDVSETPIPLRERFLNKKRTLSNGSSPVDRKRFVSGNAVCVGLSSLSSTCVSQSSLDEGKGDDDNAEEDEVKQGVKKKKLLMNQYLCFGGSRLCVKSSIRRRGRHSRADTTRPILTVSCH